MERSKRRARPDLEGLEGRALLSASKAAGVMVTPSAQVASGDRLSYTTTGGGARVTVTLTGVGSLAGSSVGADGALNLVYFGTNESSRIIGRVVGGTGHTKLGTISDANVPIGSLTGVGAEVVGIVRLPDFDLVSGGSINLLGGVNELTLNSVAPNSQIHLRDTPLNTTVEALLPTDISTTGGVTTTGAGTLDPTSDSFGGGNVGAVSGAIDFIDTVGNGQNAQGTPGLTQTQVSSGRSNSYFVLRNGGLRLTAAGGTFTSGANLIEPRDISKPGPRVAPPGVIISINKIQGASSAARVLDDLQIADSELAGTALIDVQGNVQSFRAESVNGLVLNDAGNLNLLRIKRLANSAIVGLPISHLKIGTRANSPIVSSSRLIGTRGGVTSSATIVRSGPLALP